MLDDAEVISDCLYELPPLSAVPAKGLKSVATQPHRPANAPVATIIDGDPREVVGDVFVIDGNEYLVPRQVGDGLITIAVTERVDSAEKITLRGGKRQLGQLIRTTNIPDETLRKLRVAVTAWEAADAPKARLAAKL